MKRNFSNWCVEWAHIVERSPFGNNSRFWLRLWLIAISSASGVLALLPTEAQETNAKDYSPPSTDIRQLSEIEKPATTLSEWLTQIAQTSVVQVTGVRAKPTDKGVEVILQTTQGEQLQITNRSAENNFIADIPNAQLRLPSGDAFTFRSEKPVEGITEITVTNFDANTIRVTVIGETGLPTVELFGSNEGLTFALTPNATAMQPEPEQPTSETPQEEPSAQGDESIEVLVTGQQDDGYNPANTTTGTRTDTPIRDVPQSIQVIPRQVIEDQGAVSVTEALRNVPGVVPVSPARRQFSLPIIRGFGGFGSGDDLVRRNGLRDSLGSSDAGETAGVERIEVLRGPASVLYGQGSLGGIINIVTEQPLSEPFYEIEGSVGNYDFYRGTVDLSGPINDAGSLLYRLNVAAETSGSFRDFYERERYLVAPVCGNLQGLGFGLGLFYVGERQGDLANTFALPSYLRTDASLFYEQNNFRGALNIQNLFDIDYFDASQNRLRVYLGDPFTIVGSVSWEF